MKSVEELDRALESGDIDGGRSLIAEYLEQIDDVGDIGEKTIVKKVLTTLRDYTLFDELQEVGKRIKKYDPDNPKARRLYSQALIDRGLVTEAVRELWSLKELLEQTIEELRESTKSQEVKRRNDAKDELFEVFGLLGRAYKQLYVDATPNIVEPRTHDLERAVDFYSRAFQQSNANYWHGVNFMALKTHHERMLSDQPNKRSREAGEAAEIVLRTLEDVQERQGLGPWGLASRAEAQLALGQNAKAIKAVEKYLDDERLTRFALQSTLRQFEELWELKEESPPGRQIIPMMKARLAQLPGGRIELDLSVNYETVWGDVSYQPIEWLKTGLERSRSVARLGRSLFDGSGTGWLFDGSLLGATFQGKPLLITNAHVCTSDEKVRNELASIGLDVLPPEEAVVGFLGAATNEAPAQPIKVEEVFTSPPDEFDATLLLLDSSPAEIKPFPRAQTAVAAGDRVNVIGHPHGKRLSVSLQDNEVTEVEKKYLYYKAPTDPGSSGSPIFNQKWELVGLHHASRKAKKANEGIHVDRIIAAIKEAVV